MQEREKILSGEEKNEPQGPPPLRVS